MKRCKISIFLIIVILIIGVPLLVNCLFKIELSGGFWVAEWSAGEFLSYYGAVLSFGATVILSLLALWQNEIIKRESDKHTEMLEKMEFRKCQPFFSVRNKGCDIHYSNITMEIKNISENPAFDISNIELTIKRKEHNVTILENFKEYLLPGEGVIFNLNNGFLDSLQEIVVRFECKDLYGKSHIFQVYCNDNDSQFRVKKELQEKFER